VKGDRRAGASPTPAGIRPTRAPRWSRQLSPAGGKRDRRTKLAGPLIDAVHRPFTVFLLLLRNIVRLTRQRDFSPRNPTGRFPRSLGVSPTRTHTRWDIQKLIFKRNNCYPVGEKAGKFPRNYRVSRRLRENQNINRDDDGLSILKSTGTYRRKRKKN